MPPSVKNYHSCLICLQTFLPTAAAGQNKNGVPKKQPQDAEGEEAAVTIKLEGYLRGSGGESGDGDIAEEEKQPGPEVDLYRRFLLFLKKYFKLWETSRNFEGGREKVRLIVFCDGCCQRIREICDLFGQLEVIEMLLKWKLREVGDSMEVGSKSVSKKLKNGLMRRLMEQLGVEAVSRVERFRSVIRLKCKEHSERSSPQVVVYRGYVPEELQFPMSSIRQMLMRLIVLYALASVVPAKIKPLSEVEGAVSNLTRKESRRPQRKVRTKLKLREMGDQGSDGEKIGESIMDNHGDDDYDPGPGNGSDSDWSAGGAPSPAASNLSEDLNVKDNNLANTRRRRRKRKWDLRLGQRKIKLFCEEEQEDRHGELELSDDGDGEIDEQKLELMEKKVECSHCSKMFSAGKALCQHITLAHGIPGTRNLCRFCGIQCKSTCDLYHHYMKYHKKEYKLSQKIRVRIAANKRKPRRSENPQVLYPCSECDQQFTRKTHLLLHKNYNHPQLSKRNFDKIKYCDVCATQFFNLESDQQHFLKVHGGLFDCLNCDAGFATNQELWSHLLTHETDSVKHYGCHFCMRGFCTRQSYELHYKICHRDNTRFICDDDQCGLVFGSNLDVTNHMKTHLVDPDKGIFNCDSCDLTFLNENRKNLHELEHLTPDTDGYECPNGKCNLKFELFRYLVWHYNSRHGTNIKPVSCLICEERFTVTNKLRYHYRYKHGNVPKDKEIINAWFKKHPAPTKYSKFEGNRKPRRMNKKIKVELLLLDPQSPTPRSTNQEVKLKREGKNLNDTVPTNVKIPACEADDCGKVMASAYLLRKHLEEEHEEKIDIIEKTLSCFHCSLTFKWDQSRKLHLRAKHKKIINDTKREDSKRYVCDDIDCVTQGFETVKQLNEHLISHEKTIHYCSKCDWGFMDENRMKKHELVHNIDVKGEAKIFPCPDCPKVCTTLSNSRAHYKNKHMAQEEKSCDICHLTFKRATGLRFHKRRFHKIGKEEDEEKKRLEALDNSPKCEDCGEVFHSVSGRNYHQKREHGRILDYVCHICGDSFDKQTHLEHHLPRHKTVGDWTCEVCGKSFKRQYSMKNHIRNQHQERPESSKLICPDCGKVFVTKEGLWYHVLSTHKPESEWPLKCPNCPRRFYRRMLMNMHLKNCGGGGAVGDGGGGGGRKKVGGKPRKRKRIEEEEEAEMTDGSTSAEEEEKVDVKEVSEVPRQQGAGPSNRLYENVFPFYEQLTNDISRNSNIFQNTFDSINMNRY